MRQRGRKSASALTAVSDLTGRVPVPVAPSSLTKAELAIWRRTVDRSPVGFFSAEQGDLLALYCAHVAEAERLRVAARADDLTLPEFSKILSLQQKESALALAYARSLRLTTQSRMGARTAGAKADGLRPGIAALWVRDVEPDESDGA